MTLTGCSSQADYTDAEGHAAVAYYVAHDGGVPLPTAADHTRLLGIVKKYCEGVAATSIANMNAAFQPDAAAVIQKTASIYCPLTMAAGR